MILKKKLVKYNRPLSVTEAYILILHNMKPFEKTVYLEVEKDFRNRNEDNDANEIFIEMKRQEASGLTGIKRIVDQLSWRLTRYGTNLNRLFGFWSMLIVISVIIFYMADVYVEVEKTGGTRLLKEKEAFIYSLQNSFPLVDLKYVDVKLASYWLIGFAFAIRFFCYILLSFGIYGLSTKASRGNK